MTDIAPTWVWATAGCICFLTALFLWYKRPDRLGKDYSAVDVEPLEAPPELPQSYLPSVTSREQPQYLKPSHRPYTLRTPDEIFHDFDNRTDLQAERAVQAYIGKWLRLEGMVYNVKDSINGDTISVWLDTESMIGIVLHFRKARWLRDLETIVKGDKIAAEGQIAHVERRLMSIDHCEVIEISRTDNQATNRR